MADDSTRDRAWRVWTVPNLLSVLRLAGVPVFLWLVLGPEADAWALLLLAVMGVTDFLDGYLARRLGQTSDLGQVLDPVADRLYILAVVVGLALREVIPWWVALSLPLRDLLLWGLVPLLRTRGYSALPVHFLGKAATFNLLYAFPLLLLGDGDGDRRHPGERLRLGLRDLGDRPVLVGRGPLRLAGPHPACAPPSGGRRLRCLSTPARERARRVTPLLTLITQQSLDEDYQHAAERRARGQRPAATARDRRAPRRPWPWSRCSGCWSPSRPSRPRPGRTYAAPAGPPSSPRSTTAAPSSRSCSDRTVKLRELNVGLQAAPRRGLLEGAGRPGAPAATGHGDGLRGGHRTRRPGHRRRRPERHPGPRPGPAAAGQRAVAGRRRGGRGQRPAADRALGHPQLRGRDPRQQPVAVPAVRRDGDRRRARPCRPT